MLTKVDLKKLVIVMLLVIGGVGIGSYAVYEYSVEQKLAIAEAKMELLRNQVEADRQQEKITPVITAIQPIVPVPPDNSAAELPAPTMSAGGTPVTQLGHSVVVTNRNDLISVDRAREIAAAAVGVSADKLVVYEVELTNHNGKVKYKHGYVYNGNPMYIMKCSVNNGVYYKIKIDAVDGRVYEID